MAYDAKALYKAIEDRKDFYLEAQMYAEKGGDLIDSDPVLRAALDDRPTRFNYTGAIVRAYVSKLIPAEVTINGETSEVISADLDLLKWDKQTDQHIMDLCKYGDAYMMVWPYEGENGEARVTVRAVDPISTILVYDEEDDSPVVAARSWIEGEGNKRIYRVNIYDAEKLYRWYSVDKDVWEPFEEVDEEGNVEASEVVHGIGAIPIVHSSTPYGNPVHYEAYGAQDMVMRTVVAHASAMSFQGWPQIYALYEMATGGGTSELGDTRAADEDSDSRTEVQKLKRDPGSIWALHAKELGQLQPADSSNFIDTLSKYVSVASSLAGVPEKYFASPGGQQPSAESQRAAEAFMGQVVAKLQKELSGTFELTLSMALTAQGNPTPESAVDAPWKAAEIQGDSDFWATALVKQQAGVSVRQTLTEAGYDSGQVDEFMQDGGDEASLLARATILNTMADAITKLTASVSTGFVDQTTVTELINQLFGSIMSENPDGNAT